jgi:N-acetylglucosaminyldiphosphoundecaprenol N-acetyl-beta-D-mannosaminyltransferase
MPYPSISHRARSEDAAPPVEVFGLRVFDDVLDKIPVAGSCATIQTISPNSYGMATKDRQFRTALEEADYLVLDGVYFALGSLLLKGKGIKPNQGPEVFHHFMRRLDASGGRAFFLGSTEETLAKIRGQASRDYPRIEIATYSPPYKHEFSLADNDAMVAAINAFEADIVFVGMTAPKQEKWAHAHRDRLNAHLVISIGAVFDWFAGNEKSIAPIWWKLRLAWLIRTIHRPAILRRYPNIGIFFWHLLLAMLRIRRQSA